MTVAEKIKSLRISHGLSQKQLADKIGVSQTAVYNWERGERLPKYEQICKLAGVFGVPTLVLQSDTFTHEVLKNDSNKKYFRPLSSSEELISEGLFCIIEGLYSRCKSICIDIYDENDNFSSNSAYFSVGEENKIMIQEHDWDSLQEIVCDLIKKIVPMIGVKETPESIDSYFKENDYERIETREEKTEKVYVLSDYGTENLEKLYKQFFVDNPDTQKE